MKLLQRYYEYPLLVKRIEDLTASKELLEKQLAEMSACRQSDIEKWNKAFDVERKGLESKIDSLHQQLLKVCGLIQDANSPIEDGQSSNNQPSSNQINRPGSKALSKDLQAELAVMKMLADSQNEEDKVLLEWMKLQDGLNDESILEALNDGTQTIG